MLSFSLVSPPETEPVSLAEAKAHARIDTDADDALIAALIVAARQWAEHATGRAFITQTWQLSLDAPEGREIFLPRAPLQRVSSLQFFDDADTAHAWPNESTFVDTSHEPGRLVLRSGAVWPSPRRAANGLKITYVGGYGDDAASVPQPIRLALMELVTAWYQHRGDETKAPTAAAQALLAPYRVRWKGAVL